MIYEDERTVDEMVDDILSTGETEASVRNTETKSVGGAQNEPQEERTTCRKCGKLFTRRAGSGRTMCEECFRMSHSRKKNTAKAETIQEAWDRLGEAAMETIKDKPAEREPESMEKDEVYRTALNTMRRSGGIILSLYEMIRCVARESGKAPGGIIQTLYELDCILERAERMSEA